MALRLRRDVQKASYYVWFLGAEEAKGLRGTRVINSVLPYLIDRVRSQEPLKVTLQVSHKGIKILQGSSKHFIPHSAITSSVQTDDIVACVLLLYNPATKCPLHVHAYRCDSETTANALHQQLQTLINRPENQKRFEELETRLGILPPTLPATSGNKSSSHINNEHSQKPHFQSQQQQQLQRRHETSPKRFSSSLGSDTGHSTRESECSEEHLGGSPLSRSPPIATKPLPQPNNELFDSLAAELRAKLNGNGPPILLPPRDYDTVHRSKGNLTAIELRRCRNKLIVGGDPPSTSTATPKAVQTTIANGKQVSSRGSSGIGSDLAPSPERQELNSSSDDEHWSNEADNSVIALKPAQIPIDRSAPIIARHPQLNRKSAMQPPEDSYLRDLPSKPYMPRPNNNKVAVAPITNERDPHSKTLSTAAWSREDEIKPIIMRPADYDAKFNRVLQAEQKQEYQRRGDVRGITKEHAKLQDTDKYNEINRLLSKKLSLERDSPDPRYKHKVNDLEDFDDSDPSSDHVPPVQASSSYRKENLTDKQKFMEYSSKKQQSKIYSADEQQRYGGRHRYVDPADLPFEQAAHNKYAAVHRGAQSPEPRSDLELGHRTAERHRERQREIVEVVDGPRCHSRDKEREREHFSRSNERNPYREPESIPYIKSMEKMMKSSAMRYKSFEGAAEPSQVLPKEDSHTKVSQRSKSYPKHESDLKMDRDHNQGRGRPEYAASATSNVTPKDRFKDAKDKFHAMERTGSRYDLTDEKEDSDYKLRLRGSVEPADSARVYDDWSEEESPPPPPVSRSTREARDDHWEQSAKPTRERDLLPPPREHARERETRDHREYGREIRTRETSGKRPDTRDKREHGRDMRDRDHGRDMRESRDAYRDHRYEPPARMAREPAREPPRDHLRSTERERERPRDHSREYALRDYTPEPRQGPDHRSDYPVRSMDKQRIAHSPHPDMYPSPTPPTSGAPAASSKSLSNLAKGYRHSYAEPPVFTRSAGRVGLAAVNPY